MTIIAPISKLQKQILEFHPKYIGFIFKLKFKKYFSFNTRFRGLALPKRSGPELNKNVIRAKNFEILSQRLWQRFVNFVYGMSPCFKNSFEVARQRECEM